jgi:hypothetical protein
MKSKLLYKLCVLALRVAKFAAVKHGCASAVLADAEGDVRYGQVRQRYDSECLACARRAARAREWIEEEARLNERFDQIRGILGSWE